MQYTINVRGQLIDLSQPMVMGILNATPDSFYSGSRKQTEAEIADRANQIIAEGGRIIDVGAFSTRPGGADVVSMEEETARLKRALQIVRREQPDAIVSVDTYRPLVARRCVEEFGADMINDVSEGGLTGIVGQAIHEEGDMFETVARLGVPYILMSVQPTLEKMMLGFAEEVQRLHSLGAKDIILDPGYGFGKTLEQKLRNYEAFGAVAGIRSARARGHIAQEHDIQAPGSRPNHITQRHHSAQHHIVAEGSLNTSCTRCEGGCRSNTVASEVLNCEL